MCNDSYLIGRVLKMTRSSRISSLPLQVVLYFDGWFLVLFYISELVLLIYKAATSAYPPGNLAAEIILLLVLCLLDVVRIFLGAKGNLTERKLPLLLSIVFVFPLIGGYLYLTVWQTRIHQLEYVLLAIGYTGLVLELLIGLVTLIVFQRSEILG